MTKEPETADSGYVIILNYPYIERIVRALNRSSLSILELLEYEISHKDINQALAAGILQFDKPIEVQSTQDGGNRYGDYYFQYLNSRVRLSKLGLAVLDSIEKRSNSITKGLAETTVL